MHEKVIGRAGGRIDSVDGRVSIEFPGEAVAEPLRVRITHEDPAEFESIPGHPFMTVWEFEAFAPGRNDAKVERFPEKIEVSTNYTPEDFFGLAPSTLQLWTWDEREQGWAALEGEYVPYTGVFKAEVDHFSVFGGTADENMIIPPFLDAYQTNLQTGASLLTFPLDLPPGRAGLEPNLTLSYSSDRVNEMKTLLSKARGWARDGTSLFPALGRCTPARPRRDTS